MGEIIDGAAAARAVRAAVQQEVSAFQHENGYAPGLATVLVGDNAASASYVRSKHKACAEVGIFSEAHELSAATTQVDLVALVQELNEQPNIHCILVQLQLPPPLYADAVIELLENRELRERFAARGYEKAREQFEAARLTRKLEALYTDLMELGNA
jgi:methylenetetrahydrofolate dehydrogenase (NADP+)/methenyltetrahydrofolate cyclohydrolase